MANDIKVKIGADTNQLQTGLNQATTSVNNFAAKSGAAGNAVGKMQNAMTTAGAVGSKAMASLQGALGPLLVGLGALMGLKSLGDSAGQINDLSQRFGESAETMQKVAYAADQSGTSIETIAKSMNKAELAAIAAAEGNQEYTDAFASLGLTAEEFAGLPMEEKLAAIAKGYEGNTNKAEALAAMVKIMGKSASELVPLFAQGGEAVTEMMGLAATASSNSIARIDEVQDRFGGMFSTLKVWAFEALGFVIDLVDKMSIGIAAAIAFVSNLGSGIEDAKQAYQDTLQAGLDLADEQKAAREERKNKISAANIAEIKQEVAAEQTDKAKEDVKPKPSEPAKDVVTLDGENLSTLDDLKALKRQDAEEAKKRKQAKVAAAQDKEEDAGGKLDLLKRQDANNVNLDSLRRIGGGFAKSDYSGVSKQEQTIQKQVDLAQKQVDELKKVVEALKKTESFDGIDD